MDFNEAQMNLEKASEQALVAIKEFVNARRDPVREWWDHRTHLLDPETEMQSGFILHAANLLSPEVPLDQELPALDLCCGDGFFAYYFLRRHFSNVICLERDAEAVEHAIRLYNHPNIEYRQEDVNNLEVSSPGSFGIVLIRGAIEHFNQQEQDEIFRKSAALLHPAGRFVGDTVSENENDKNDFHSYEWKDEAAMRSTLERWFGDVKTRSFVLNERKTILLFNCGKRLPGDH